VSAQLADVTFDRTGSIAIATLSGEIDMSNAMSIRQRIAEFVTPDDDAVVLDFSGLSFIDSAGLHAVFELSSALDERRQRLLVCVPPGGQVDRSVGIVGMPRAVSVHRTFEEALRAARAERPEARPFPPGT
jgi:anti-sigma B factor antagonist